MSQRFKILRMFMSHYQEYRWCIVRTIDSTIMFDSLHFHEVKKMLDGLTESQFCFDSKQLPADELEKLDAVTVHESRLIKGKREFIPFPRVSVKEASRIIRAA